MRHWVTALLLLLAVFTWADGQTSHAVTLTWNVAGDGSWDTTSPNWNPGATTFPDDGSADVVFDNTAGGTITIATDMTPASVTVSAASGTYTFTGGPIDGSGGLTKSGGGELRINSANSYTGATSIQYGTVVISNAEALGTGGGTTTLVGSNGNTGSSLSLSGGITVDGTLHLQATSSGRSTLKNSSGSNEWAGAIDITSNGNHPMFQIDSGSLTVSGDITGTVTGGSFYIRGNGTGRITGNVDITGDLHKRDGGTWIIGNATESKTYAWSTTTVDRGVLGFAVADVHPDSVVLSLGSDQSGAAIFKLGDGTTGYDQTVAGLATGGSGTTERKIVGGGPNVATLTVNNTNTYTYTGNLGGTGTHENNLALKKTGSGGLTLAGDNTYTGITTVERGTLTVTHANALGSTAGGTILAGVAGGGEVSIAISGGITVAEPLYLAASIQRANLKNDSGDNTWAGPIDITSAGLQQPMIYSSTNGTLTVTGDITGTNTPHFYIRGSGTTDNWISGSVDITGDLFKRDTGTWMLGDPSGTETYNWSGTTVEAGILKFAAANVHPDDAVLTLDTNQGYSATVMLGDETTGYDQTVAGLRTLNSAAHNVVGGGANVATLTIDTSGSYTYADVIGGTGAYGNNLALTKSGSGTQTLSGTTANTYTGLTTINNGALILAKSAGVDAVGGDATVAGGTLQWSQDNQLPDTATLVQTGGYVNFNGMDETLANFTKSGGSTNTGGDSTVITITDTFTLSGGSTFNFNSPSTILANTMIHTGGVITLGGSGTLLGIGTGGLEMTGATITLNRGSTGAVIQLDGDVTVHNSTASAQIIVASTGTDSTAIDLNAGTRTFTVADGAADSDLSVETAIRNGGLIKAGAGTMLLSGANTYTGITDIDAGTFVLNGTHTGGDAYTVAANAILAGSGSTDAAVDVNDDGILSPGSSAGTLSTGSLALSSTSLLAFELDAPNLGDSTLSDRIDVTGDLVLDGILDIDPLTGFGAPEAGDRWRLFNYTGSLTDNGLDVLLTNLPELAKDLHYEIDTSIASQVDLLIGVPEPASLLLISFSLPWLLRRRRRPHHA